MKIVGHEKKELLDGHAENRCLATFLCAAPFTESLNHTTQTRKKKNMETRIHTHSHTHNPTQHNPEEASSSETTLCIYCIRGQSHSLPFLRTVYTQAEIYTHTHTHTREHAQTHAPSTRFLTLEILLAVIYATHIHTLRNEHPLVSFLQQISQIPA